MKMRILFPLLLPLVISLDAAPICKTAVAKATITPKNYPVPVQVIYSGGSSHDSDYDGEVVVDYSLRLKRELGKNHSVWVAGYSNDVMGYIPSLCVLDEGGYEGGGNMRYIRSTPHSGPWAETVVECLIEHVYLLDRRLTFKP